MDANEKRKIIQDKEDGMNFSNQRETAQVWLDGIFGLATGDALGCPVQFNAREEMDANPVTDMIGHGTFDMPAGSWTDDTSLALATMDSILRCGRLDPVAVMQCYGRWLLKGEYTPFGKAYDIGHGTMDAILCFLSNDFDVTTCGGAEAENNGNGSLMRILPTCLYLLGTGTAEEEAVRTVEQISALTHAHPRSKLACGIYYYLVRALLEAEPSADASLTEVLQRGINEAMMHYENEAEYQHDLPFYERCRDLSALQGVKRENIRSSGYVVDSLEAALWCAITTGSYEEAMLRCINLGEDTDTIAAIGGGLCGLYYGLDAIPASWRQQLARKIYIKDLCERMAQL